jgi:hypothetical protein
MVAAALYAGYFAGESDHRRTWRTCILRIEKFKLQMENGKQKKQM